MVKFYAYMGHTFVAVLVCYLFDIFDTTDAAPVVNSIKKYHKHFAHD